MNPSSGRQHRQPNGTSAVELDDVIYSGSDDEYYDSPTERLRQYELQKQRFLQGRPLTILSAQLRGPFTKESGWRNPWLGRSQGHSRTKHGTTEPVAQRPSVNRSNTTAACVPDSATKTDLREFGRAHITVAPLRVDRLTQSSSCHLPSPVSSNACDTVSNPYMDRDAWARVQAWRIDVAAEAEPSEESRPIVVLPHTGLRPSKRPANSELLRNALAKKRRYNGLAESAGEPFNPSRQNDSPITSQSAGSNTPYSTPNAQSLQRSHISLAGLSQAALDGSVAGQTHTPRAAQNNISPAANAVAKKCPHTPKPLGLRGDKIIDFPETPAQQPRPLSAIRRPGLMAKASSPERGPLRPNLMKINAMIRDERLSHQEKKSQVMGEISVLRSSVNLTGSEETPALDFCSQADQSFQYRSKVPRLNNKRAAVETPPNASQSTQSPGNHSRNTEPRTVEGPRDAELHNTSAVRTKVLCMENTVRSSMATNKMDEDTNFTPTPGIDGPTLIPTSSPPSLQQAALPFTDDTEDGTAAERDIRRKGDKRKDNAMPEPKSTPNSNTSPHAKARFQGTPMNSVLAKVLTQREHRQGDAQNDKKDTTPDAVDSTIRPRPQSSFGAIEGNLINSHEQVSRQDQEGTVHSSTDPGIHAAPPVPQQQSPWTKEVIHMASATPRPRAQSPIQQSPILEAPYSGFNKTMGERRPVASPLQQSPWIKETPKPAANFGPDVPSVSMNDYTKLDLCDTEPVQIAESQNPWAFDERQVTNLDRLSRKQSPVRMANTVTNEGPTGQAPPSTPATKQSSLPTPDLTSSVKSFRDFISPSPEPRRRSKPALFQEAGIGKPQRRKSILSKGKGRAKRGHFRVSFALPGESQSQTSIMEFDPDETMEGAELPSRAATSPSLVRLASSRLRAASPPLQLSQSELPAEGTRFSKFFRAQARKGPQVRRTTSYKPLLPSASQQICSSPGVDAMAEAFIEADRTRGAPNIVVDGAGSVGEEQAGAKDSMDGEMLSPEQDEVDDVSAVLDNLGDFLNSFNVEAELEKARREEQQRERPQEMSMQFPSTQDQMEILGTGVWD